VVGGDCFNYTWIDDDHLIVYLIDVSGHGVEPALVSVSAHNMLRSGSISAETLLAPDRVLTELNERFLIENQGGNYFTIWYGVYQASTRTLRYAAAGHPPALVLAGDRPTQLCAKSPPIGLFDDTEFTADCFAVPPGCQIVLYSDGAFEVPLPAGGSWSLPAFVELCGELAKTPDWSLDDLVERLRELSATHFLEDDCALVRLTIA
jgi:sigma-B regulation protein RsbU (phosphoserine phosphatase)